MLSKQENIERVLQSLTELIYQTLEYRVNEQQSRNTDINEVEINIKESKIEAEQLRRIRQEFENLMAGIWL